jgi:hypothetical protein
MEPLMKGLAGLDRRELVMLRPWLPKNYLEELR